MRFGLMFFASSEESLVGDKYRLVIDSARFADTHGFSSVWVPERHFTQLGCLYPNPAVLHAALARETRQVRLQAGSVVAPLHHPLRIAEEWALVDNLSGGRVGVSFASGWNPDDFALAPEKYRERHAELLATVDAVRRLWRGETLRVKSGSGEWVSVRTYPTPLQAELPVWLTAASNPETFRAAGRIGAHLLTHMLDQDAAALAQRVALYRATRARHGHDPLTGMVTVMLHTFVGEDVERVRQEVRRPYCEYLNANLHLLAGLAASRGSGFDVQALSGADREAFVGYLFERFFSTRALMGTPATCRALVAELAQAGVDEIACLLDFGPSTSAILDNLVHLEALKDSVAPSDHVVHRRLPLPEPAAPPPAPSVAGDQARADLDAIRGRCPQELSGTTFYAQLAEHGVQLEAAFAGIECVWCGEDEALGRVSLPPGSELPTLELHPALLDASLQVLVAALPERARLRAGQPLYVPVALGQWQVHVPAADRLWSHARLTVPFAAGAAIVGDVDLFDDQGLLVARATGLRLEPLATRPAEPTAVPVDWTCRCAWLPRPAEGPALVAPGEHWIVLADAGGVGHALAGLLEARGVRCTLVPRPPAGTDPWQAVRDGLSPALPACHRVVHLWALDDEHPGCAHPAALQAAQETGVLSATALIQALLQMSPGAPPRVWLVTRGAQPVSEGVPPALGHALLWGLGRTCAMEHPELWGGLVDVDPAAASATAAAQVYEALAARDGEDQVAFRDGRRHVARLERAALPMLPPLRFDPQASYLITGGVLGVSRAVAAWMVRAGARHLSILARSALPPREQWAPVDGAAEADGEPGARAVAVLRELEAAGARVEYAAVDVADEAQLRAWLRRRAAQGLPPLRGVMHAASVWRDAAGHSLVRPLEHLDREAFEAVLRPKVLGAWLLSQVLAEAELDFFVMFSSAAALFGSAGQANYAAASAFLDGLAHHLQAAGRRALSVNWGAVSELGFGASAEGLKVHEYWEARGLERLAPGDVVAALEGLLPGSLAQMGVVKMDLERLRRFYPRLAEAPFFAALSGRPGEAGLRAPDFLARLHAAPAARRRELLLDHLREQIRQSLGLPATHPIEPRRGLFDMGMDSLMALDLKNRLQASLGRSIPATLAFDYSTVETLGDYLHAELLGASPEIAPAADGDRAAETDAWTRVATLDESDVERLFAEKILRRSSSDNE